MIRITSINWRMVFFSLFYFTTIATHTCVLIAGSTFCSGEHHCIQCSIFIIFNDPLHLHANQTEKPSIRLNKVVGNPLLFIQRTVLSPTQRRSLNHSSDVCIVCGWTWTVGDRKIKTFQQYPDQIRKNFLKQNKKKRRTKYIDSEWFLHMANRMF